MESPRRAFGSASVALVAALALVTSACSKTQGSPSPPPAPGNESSTGETGAPIVDAGAPVALVDAQPDADAGVPHARLVGRFAADPAGQRFAWTGSAIVARFRGTQVTLNLRDASTGTDSQGVAYRNHFTVTIDKAAATRLVADPNVTSYVLAKGLADGVHDVTIVRDTEAFVGDDIFVGLDVGVGGALLEPAPAPAHRIEMIGDSITCGYGIEGASEKCGYSTATESGTEAYGTVAATALGAEVSTVCWSGKGVMRNGGGDTVDLLPELYLRTLPQSATSTWAFSSTPPDAVVVNLSTNDFAQGIPDQKAFVDAYRAFVGVVRQHYPAAHIFAALGPMLSDDTTPGPLSTARKYIRSAVDAGVDAGDARLHFIEFPEQNGARDGFGCDYHPDRKTANAMGAQLATALKTTLGW